jgi:hypothetical protein
MVQAGSFAREPNASRAASFRGTAGLIGGIFGQFL